MIERDLNRTIKLNNDSEYESLYSWSLEEYDSEGNKVTESFIPMQIGSIYLEVEKLTYLNNFQGSGYEPKSSKITESEFISGTLKTQADRRKDISTTNTFSMFGTNREIKTFGIEIYKVDSDFRAEESFNLTGWIGYETEADIDLPAQKIEDSIYITVVLNEERFNKIVQNIKDGIHPNQVKIGHAEGFYNRWTPSIHLSDIKILTDEKERYGDENTPYAQHIEIPKDCDITPPRIGKLKDFNIGFLIESNESVDENSETEDEDYYEDDDELDNANEQESSTDTISSQLSQISDLGNLALRALKFPLWIIAVTLLLILIFK